MSSISFHELAAEGKLMRLSEKIMEADKRMIQISEKIVQRNGTKRKAEDDGGNERPKKMRTSSFAFSLDALKPQIVQAVQHYDLGQPTKFQQKVIPMMLTGKDFFFQAEPNSGKTCAFVLATLEQFDPADKDFTMLVICPTHFIAREILRLYRSFSKYMGNISMFTCGKYRCEEGCITHDANRLANRSPQIVIGTPIRVWALWLLKKLKLDKVKQFVVYDCDKMFSDHEMRLCVETIGKELPTKKQTMVLSTTLSADNHRRCLKFMNEPKEVIFNKMNLWLHRLKHFYVNTAEEEKNGRLMEILDGLEFRRMLIYVKSTSRCLILSEWLSDLGYKAAEINDDLLEVECLERHEKYRSHSTVVATSLPGNGTAEEYALNIVINYDMPQDKETYLKRAGRTQFSIKGFVVTFVDGEKEAELLQSIQGRYNINIAQLRPGTCLDYCPCF